MGCTKRRNMFLQIWYVFDFVSFPPFLRGFSPSLYPFLENNMYPVVAFQKWSGGWLVQGLRWFPGQWKINELAAWDIHHPHFPPDRVHKTLHHGHNQYVIPVGRLRQCFAYKAWEVLCNIPKYMWLKWGGFLPFPAPVAGWRLINDVLSNSPLFCRIGGPRKKSSYTGVVLSIWGTSLTKSSSSDLYHRNR